MADNGSLKPTLSGERLKLLLIIRVILKEIQLQGRRFPWKRPGSCPGCQGRRLWGHGFVLRYFHGYAKGLWMRRWRCPDCNAVHTVRPHEYPAGSAYPATTHFESLRRKLTGESFLPSVSRQAQQYWKNAFDFQRHKLENWKTPLVFFRESIINGRKPVSFSLKQRVIPSGLDPPYLNFAVTATG